MRFLLLVLDRAAGFDSQFPYQNTNSRVLLIQLLRAAVLALTPLTWQTTLPALSFGPPQLLKTCRSKLALRSILVYLVFLPLSLTN